MDISVLRLYGEFTGKNSEGQNGAALFHNGDAPAFARIVAVGSHVTREVLQGYKDYDTGGDRAIPAAELPVGTT